MMIDPNFFSHLKDSPIGRVRLKLFKEITRKEKEVPTKKQSIEYVAKAAKKNYDYAELLTYLLTSGEYSILEANQLQKPISVKNLFKELNEFPLTKPVLFTIKTDLDNKDLCVWVKSHSLIDGLGYFYTLILFYEQSFPKIIFLEIRVSQIEPEPAVVIFNAGEPIVMSHQSLDFTNDKILVTCLKVLRFISDSYIDDFIPLNNPKLLYAPQNILSKRPPKDKILIKLLKKLYSKEINCSVADVSLDQIIPFDFDYCFQVPLVMIKQVERVVKDIAERGILLYWNANNFITSDDYTAYLALRKAGYKTTKAVIVGDVPKSIKVIKEGGLELLPPLMSIQRNSYNNLPLPIKKYRLAEYIQGLQTMARLQDISECKCAIFSEDTNTALLENVLISSGFDIDQTIIYSYKNCTNLDALEFNINAVRKINPEIKIVIHRDRDYITDLEIEKIKNTILKLEAYPFITQGTDIESYYLNIKHIHSLYKKVPIKKISEIYRSTLNSLKEESIQRIKKYEHGDKYQNKSTHFDAYIQELYDKNEERFIFGKKAIGVLTSLLQKEIKINPNLIQVSSFVKDSFLEEISKLIWPNKSNS